MCVCIPLLPISPGGPLLPLNPSGPYPGRPSEPGSPLNPEENQVEHRNICSNCIYIYYVIADSVNCKIKIIK